jgi:hypothetical protein
MPEFAGYSNEAEIQEVVSRFESCAYQPEEFFHARHLTVAAWYFLHFDGNAAEERMRAGLRRFIRHHRKNAYHVTMTEFWLRLVKHTLQQTGANDDSVSRVNQVVERLNSKNLIHEYYTREQLDRPEAKTEWIEPQSKPMPSVL